MQLLRVQATSDDAAATSEQEPSRRLTTQRWTSPTGWTTTSTRTRCRTSTSSPSREPTELNRLSWWTRRRLFLPTDLCRLTS